MASKWGIKPSPRVLRWWKRQGARGFRRRARAALRRGVEPPYSIKAVSSRWDID